jgi:hypothetical protein
MADVRSTVTTPIASDFAIGAAVDNAGTPIVVDRVAGTAYILDSTDTVTALGGGGGGAPTNATYLTLSLNGALTNERVLTAGTNIAFVDTGANGTLTVSSSVTRSVGVTFDGGGSAITALSKADIRVPYAGTITAVTMLADQVGSIVVDIWKDTYAAFPPTGADSITAAAKPTITADDQSVDTTLVGWTTAITANDCLRFNVDSCATITRCTLILTVTS